MIILQGTDFSQQIIEIQRESPKKITETILFYSFYCSFFLFFIEFISFLGTLFTGNFKNIMCGFFSLLLYLLIIAIILYKTIKSTNSYYFDLTFLLPLMTSIISVTLFINIMRKLHLTSEGPDLSMNVTSFALVFSLIILNLSYQLYYLTQPPPMKFNINIILNEIARNFSTNDQKEYEDTLNNINLLVDQYSNYILKSQEEKTLQEIELFMEEKEPYVNQLKIPKIILDNMDTINESQFIQTHGVSPKEYYDHLYYNNFFVMNEIIESIKLSQWKNFIYDYNTNINNISQNPSLLFAHSRFKNILKTSNPFLSYKYLIFDNYFYFSLEEVLNEFSLNNDSPLFSVDKPASDFQEVNKGDAIGSYLAGDNIIKYVDKYNEYNYDIYLPKKNYNNFPFMLIVCPDNSCYFYGYSQNNEGYYSQILYSFNNQKTIIINNDDFFHWEDLLSREESQMLNIFIINHVTKENFAFFIDSNNISSFNLHDKHNSIAQSLNTEKLIPNIMILRGGYNKNYSVLNLINNQICEENLLFFFEIISDDDVYFYFNQET